MSKRETKEFIIQQTKQLLENPIYKRTTDALSTNLIKELCSVRMDGSKKNERRVLELVRELQAVNRLDSAMKGAVRRTATRNENKDET